MYRLCLFVDLCVFLGLSLNCSTNQTPIRFVYLYICVLWDSFSYSFREAARAARYNQKTLLAALAVSQVSQSVPAASQSVRLCQSQSNDCGLRLLRHGDHKVKFSHLQNKIIIIFVLSPAYRGKYCVTSYSHVQARFQRSV